MAPGKGKNRQKEFSELIETGAADFDPEDDQVSLDDENDSDSSQRSLEHDGREHYVETEKSNLRKPKAVALGPRYRGSRVGRDALESDGEDDPFSRGFREDNSDDSSDSESAGHDLKEDHPIDSEDEEAEDLSDATQAGDHEDNDMDRARSGQILKDRQSLGAELKKAMKEDEKRSIAKLLLSANREDVEKGRAVKRQRAVFDSLLSTRMKLQKSLIATNTLVGTPMQAIDAERDSAQQAIEAAEEAASQLWNSLNSFREELLAAQAGHKRKRVVFSADNPIEDMWKHAQALESESRPNRDAVLKKWSNKAQGPWQHAETGRLDQKQQTTIIDVLQQHLSNPGRLLTRAYTPRSAAPLQLSQGINEDSKIYDDVDFYSLLLQELLEQKSQNSIAAAHFDLGYQVRREAKTKRHVDTKASKGRKLRYTVHEKLQNLMAPEDRTRWSERQMDEFFGSLFGQRAFLGEREDDEETDEVGAEEAALLMFRT